MFQEYQVPSWLPAPARACPSRPHILSIYGLSVDKIQYNSIGDATLYMGDIEVILGNSAGLNGKIAELGDMLPQLEGKSGTLYLDTYDETKTNPMYTFKPRG